MGSILLLNTVQVSNFFVLNAQLPQVTRSLQSWKTVKRNSDIAARGNFSLAVRQLCSEMSDGHVLISYKFYKVRVLFYQLQYGDLITTTTETGPPAWNSLPFLLLTGEWWRLRLFCTVLQFSKYCRSLKEITIIIIVAVVIAGSGETNLVVVERL